MSKIKVRVNRLDYVIPEEIGSPRELECSMTIIIPNELKLTIAHPHELEKFLEYCFNIGITSYGFEQNKLESKKELAQ